MTAPPSANNLAMRYASLLAYYSRFAHTQELSGKTSEALNYDILRTKTTRTHGSDKPVDEEAQPELDTVVDVSCFDCKNCRGSAKLRYEENRCTLYDLCSLFCVLAFTCCVFLFALDSLLNRYGVGTGIAECLVQSSAASLGSNYRMQFCLVSPNREAPGPQIWSTEFRNTCATEIITLYADQAAQWNLRNGDRLSVSET